MEILIAILVLGIIIFIHELGHFMTAKFFKMPVSEFSIGMGPQVYSYETIKTTYSFRAIPIGGFVNIEGMEVDSKLEDGFNSKPAYARFIVLIAGVFMNFLLAFIIMFSSIYINGKPVISEKPIIGNIFKEAQSIEYLKIKDRIVEIDGKKIESWKDISEKLKGIKEADKLYIKLERDGKIEGLEVPLTYDSNTKNYMLGILPEYSIEKFSVIEATELTFKSGVKIVGDTIAGLKMMITGQVKAKEISGPIGIIKVVGEASRDGLGIVLWLMALLSINVGVLNLLPLPALDGGRIIFVLLEMMGIKVNKKLEERVHMAGMLVLFGLIIFITTNDIFNLVK
ncbi:RIP metalloprotease [Fusobacterium sp.]|uniref:M50 family metallopeptidase n=1 Tax=Fusobacterium sp. TaxID=68766 RepID=UPI0025C5CB0A|nr:M50 family metallopeptidase [Fusobacterium sp.]